MLSLSKRKGTHINVSCCTVKTDGTLIFWLVTELQMHLALDETNWLGFKTEGSCKGDTEKAMLELMLFSIFITVLKGRLLENFWKLLDPPACQTCYQGEVSMAWWMESLVPISPSAMERKTPPADHIRIDNITSKQLSESDSSHFSW